MQNLRKPILIRLCRYVLVENKTMTQKLGNMDWGSTHATTLLMFQVLSVVILLQFWILKRNSCLNVVLLVLFHKIILTRISWLLLKELKASILVKGHSFEYHLDKNKVRYLTVYLLQTRFSRR